MLLGEAKAQLPGELQIMCCLEKCSSYPLFAPYFLSQFLRYHKVTLFCKAVEYSNELAI